MVRMTLTLLFFFILPGSHLSNAEEGIDAVTSIPVKPFREALESAELIFMGQVERVETIEPPAPGDFDRRSLFRVLEHFKGPEEKEVFVYFRYPKKGDNSDGPSGIWNQGGKLIIFAAKNGRNYVTSYNDGSGDFSFYPNHLTQAPKSMVCKLNALRAYKKNRPLEEVLEIQKCIQKQTGKRRKKIKYGSEEHIQLLERRMKELEKSDSPNPQK